MTSCLMRRFGRICCGILVVATIGLMGWTFQIGAQKNLVGTINGNEWGRYMHAIAAALTKAKTGVGGFVADSPISVELLQGGLTDNERISGELGFPFPSNLANAALLESALQRAQALRIERVRPYLVGGDDVGLVTFSRMAFATFGTHVKSLYYAYFLLLSIAIILFISRFYAQIPALVALVLVIAALFVMTCSDLVNVERSHWPFVGEHGSDLKDPRFFGTIATIPALHLLMTWLRRDRLGASDYVAIGAQAFILAFAFHVRTPVAWVAMALAASWLVLFCQRRGDPGATLREAVDWRSTISVYPLAVFSAAIAGTSLAVAASLHPLYAQERAYAYHPVSPGLIYSLQFHPQWEAKYAASVNYTTVDATYTEIAKIHIARLPADARAQHLTKDGWPTREAIARFSRERFLEILREDPAFVAETFLIYKPGAIAESIWLFHSSALKAVTALQWMGLLATVVLAAAILAGIGGEVVLLRLFPIAVAFSIVSLLPNLISPATQHHMVDHFVWSITALLSILVIGAAYLSRKAARRVANVGSSVASPPPTSPPAPTP
jgi:hypothetical protein